MNGIRFKFIEKKNLWFFISTVFIGIGLSLMVSRALSNQSILNYGVDFKGGTSMILKFESLDMLHSKETSQDVKADINMQFISDLRQVLIQYGLEKSTIQISQSLDVLIKTLKLQSEKSQLILDHLRKNFGDIEILEIDFIGPSIGEELKDTSIWIILIASFAILLYISLRFEWRYGISALMALLHDALITLSFAAILNIEINTAFVAALLTILGYSINDTIVIFDRIRENSHLHQDESMTTIANLSLNQTMVRSINTSITTLLVISALIFFGGTTIKAFCLVLLIGIMAGTYSSIFIASPFLIQLHPKDNN